jgi:hypothetical protein
VSAPRYNVPTPVQQAEAAALAAIEAYRAAPPPRDARTGGVFASAAMREYSALARPVELANDLSAFRYAEWDCDGFEEAIGAVARLGDGTASKTEAFRVVGVVAGILADAAQTEADVLQKFSGEEDFDATESVRLIRAVSAQLAKVASTLVAIHERPEASEVRS